MAKQIQVNYLQKKFDKRIKKITWLKGGIWSHAYRLQFADDSTIVAKQVEKLELDLLRFLSKMKVNPLNIFDEFIVRNKLWVVMKDLGEISGRVLEQKGLLKKYKNKILYRIHKFHDVNLKSMKFKVPSLTSHQILQEINKKILFLQKKKQISLNRKDYLKKLLYFNDAFKKQDKVFCHADTYLENFLFRNNEIIFVDFEISRLFYPEIDLACLCFSMNDKSISNGFVETYYKKYCGGDRKSFDEIYDFCMIFRALHVAYMLQKEGELVENRDFIVDKAILVFAVKSFKRNLISKEEFKHIVNILRHFDINKNKRWITDDIKEFNKN